MRYQEEEYLLLSGIQHFAFCRRQWALIHVEKQWGENLLTAEGHILHERAHNDNLHEKRNDLIIVRGMKVSSAVLGISGECDIVEYHKNETGIPIAGYEGTWTPYPVEYKRGSPKNNDADRLQLCAQAMCLEEMLCCDITEGALYYGEIRRRERVEFKNELRKKVEEMLIEMHQYYSRGYTPKVKQQKGCTACSLSDVCLPKLMKRRSVQDYISSFIEEQE